MRFPGYIPDGYTYPGYIKEGATYPAVRFNYRPFRPEARAIIIGQIQKAEDDEAQRLQAKAICTAIDAKNGCKWDLKDDKGQIAAITESVLLNNIDSSLANKLANIVLQAIASDTDPEWDADDKKKRDADKLAIALGTSPAEADSKN
jgi:hypothetical protein